MFERYHEPLLNRAAFIMRMLRCMAIAFAVLFLTIFFGTLVFHYVEKLFWIDAFLNSVLIMTGLGLVGVLNTSFGKLFAAFYSLFSALAFYSVLAIIFTPLLHRLFHHFHLDMEIKRRNTYA